MYTSLTRLAHACGKCKLEKSCTNKNLKVGGGVWQIVILGKEVAGNGSSVGLID